MAVLWETRPDHEGESRVGHCIRSDKRNTPVSSCPDGAGILGPLSRASAGYGGVTCYLGAMHHAKEGVWVRGTLARVPGVLDSICEGGAPWAFSVNCGR